MAALGWFLLLSSFVVCSYAAVASVAGARRGQRWLVESGTGAFFLVTALMTVASAVMVNAFLTDDFTIKYIAHYSESAQPLFYKLTSYWGGLDGSIMFWVFLLSVFGSIAVYVNRERHRELIPYVVATLSVTSMFFLFLMVIHKNPFDVPRRATARRHRAEPAAAELLDGHPSAVALHRVRGDDDPLRLLHRGAGHRASRRCVAARRAAPDRDQGRVRRGRLRRLHRGGRPP